ncbi:MAG: hypothetical protein U0169_05000 [Polyangiaceae bacterium]
MKLPEPRAMLLLDGLGALATAFTVGLVLPQVASSVGLEPRVLGSLGLYGVGCATYSLGCWRILKAHWARALTGIVGANLVYCGITASVVATRWEALTWLGVAYFVGEMAVIVALVAVEIAVVRASARGRP